MYRRGRPIARATSQPILDRFSVVVDGVRLPDEFRPVVEAIDVDDRAGARRGLADCADIDAAAAANQKVGGACTEAVRFDEGPILGPDFDRPMRVAGRSRVVGATERTTAGAQPCVLGRLRQVQAQAEIAAMTAAAVFHQRLSPAHDRVNPATADLPDSGT